MHGLGIHPNIHWPQPGDNADEICEAASGGPGRRQLRYLRVPLGYRQESASFRIRPVRVHGAGNDCGPSEGKTRSGSDVRRTDIGGTGEDVYIRAVRPRLATAGEKKILGHIVDLKAAVTKDMDGCDGTASSRDGPLSITSGLAALSHPDSQALLPSAHYRVAGGLPSGVRPSRSRCVIIEE